MSDTTRTTGAPASNPIFSAIQVEIRNPREFRPEGKSQTFYSADAEVPSPGHRWSTLRLKISSTTGPVPTGVRSIVVDMVDMKKGEGVGHVVEA